MPALTQADKRIGSRSGLIAKNTLIRQGIAGGVIAGISFILFEMILAWIINGDVFKPLRMIATLIMGENALSPWNSLLAITINATLLLIILSAISGSIFGYLLARRPFMITSTLRLTLTGSLYGCLLWIAFYYILSPVVGWIWFPLQTDPIFQGLIGHTVFYGAVLGYYFARRLHPNHP